MENHDKEEILEAIGLVAEHMQEMREDIHILKSDVSALKTDVSALKTDVSALKTDVSALKLDNKSIHSEIVSMHSEIGSLRNQMVTKDYLDRKIFELRGDLVYRIRKSEYKFEELVEEGVVRKMYPREVANRILSLEPQLGVQG